MGSLELTADVRITLLTANNPEMIANTHNTLLLTLLIGLKTMFTIPPKTLQMTRTITTRLKSIPAIMARNLKPNLLSDP